MFGRIARRYDRTNTVLSFGQDRRWRRVAVKQTGLVEGSAALDVACGTGPLTRMLARRVGPSGSVIGTDFTPEMLDVARRHDAPVDGAAITYEQADAQALPFADARFDAATVAFGIRNVDDPVLGLSEMLRVVRPGGRVVVLEFGQPKGPVGVGYRFYSRRVMPVIGGMLTGDREAYEYLPRTAAAFPAGDAFLDLMRQAGFDTVEKKPLMGGMVWCYTGLRPDTRRRP